MTAIPDRVSAVAGGFFYEVTPKTTISIGDIVKPQSSQTWGLSAGFSYNSTSGLFTLDATKKYQIECALFTEAQWVIYNVLHGFTDSGGTEITDSARGRMIGHTPDDYYSNYDLCCDETAVAVIDGSSVASFYWKILDINRTNSNAIELDNNSVTGWNSYAATKTRLTIREY